MERSELIEEAKFAQQTERYEDMAKYMKKVTELGDRLSNEERDLLSVAYKNVAGAKRSSWRVISRIEHSQNEGSKKEAMAAQYRGLIEKELKAICSELLTLLDDYLIQNSSVENKGFYLKMKGDYYRYLVEIAPHADSEEAPERQHAENAYLLALEFAKESISPTHPIRLSIAFNASDFYYDIMNSSSEACKIAEEALDDAIAELDQLQGEDYTESTLIMQSLRDKLTLWKAEGTTEY